jgi:hypothetical protein
MLARKNILMSVTGQSGVLTGETFCVPLELGTGRLKIPFQIELTAGTATFFLEGSNDQATWNTVSTGSASAQVDGARYVYYRFRLSASAGATIKCTTDRPVYQVTNRPT